MTHTSVVIIGAGFAGVGAAIKLRRAGEESFLLLERGTQVGGTWRDNTYPGVACDVPSHLYSFSFRHNPDWSRLFAPGREIREYLELAVDEEGIRPHLRLGTAMTEMHWDDEWALWRIQTNSGVITADSVILACGRLTEPRIPELPGLETFRGELVHAARWRDDIDFAGKRVALVGTGASAVQLVPHLAAVTGELVVFQRSAPWIVPRADRAYTAEEREGFAAEPALIDRLRDRQFTDAESMFPARAGERTALAAARAEALDHLHRQVSDATLRAALTPDYEIGCKRRLISSDYYPTFTTGRASLEPSALDRIEDATLVAASGARYEVDDVVFATGFESTQQPYADSIRGSEGNTLADHWAHGMTAYASTTVHGFPNLFIVNGPNAGLGHNSAVHMIETQLSYILQALDYLRASQTVLNVTAHAEREYTAMIDRLAAPTVWLTGGCESWYVDTRSGRLTLLWPGSAASFRERNGCFDPAPYQSENHRDLAHPRGYSATMSNADSVAP
ncbi:MAG: NAD(P)/FAD-dependent oxidoreductase [Salinibacterium sp.]|nr:NAD(P)/FAD-dependent oxidoreductase [Salinibacterium sp.]